MREDGNLKSVYEPQFERQRLSRREAISPANLIKEHRKDAAQYQDSAERYSNLPKEKHPRGQVDLFHASQRQKQAPINHVAEYLKSTQQAENSFESSMSNIADRMKASDGTEIAESMKTIARMRGDAYAPVVDELEAVRSLGRKGRENANIKRLTSKAMKKQVVDHAVVGALGLGGIVAGSGVAHAMERSRIHTRNKKLAIAASAVAALGGLGYGMHKMNQD